LVWCETGDRWEKVHACVQEIDFGSSEVQGFMHIGNPQGRAVPDSGSAIMFPEEPSPPFAWEEPKPPYKSCHQTRALKVDYCVTLSEDELDEKGSSEKEGWLDNWVEASRFKMLASACAAEEQRKQRMVNEARGWSQGWIFQRNETKMEEARNLKMKNCRLFHDLESRVEDLIWARRKPNWVALVIFIVFCTKMLGLW
jgi:hypothetical protein